MQVYGPSNEIHYTAQRQKTGSFSLLAPAAGSYRLCFSNRMSTMTDKTVAFSLHKGDELFQDIAKLGEPTLVSCGFQHDERWAKPGSQTAYCSNFARPSQSKLHRWSMRSRSCPMQSQRLKTSRNTCGLASSPQRRVSRQDSRRVKDATGVLTYCAY